MAAAISRKTLLHESLTEYAAVASNPAFFTACEWLFLLSGGLTLAYMIKLFVVLFLEKPERKQAKKAYMNRATAVVLTVSALMIPLLGLLPELTANGLARLSMPFFRLGSFEGASYFSLESLKGAMISILIGILVYFLIVRTCTMRKKARAARTSTRTPPGLIWSGTCTVRCCGSSQRWAACWRGSRIP